MKKVFIYGEKQYYKNYYIWVKKAGAIPVFSTDLAVAPHCDGLLLTGGGDISPCLYKHGTLCSGLNCVDLNRDVIEQYLIYLFTRKSKAIFGVCRGLQAINVFFGGTLTNIDNDCLHKKAKGDLIHQVINFGGFMQEIYGQKCQVNSCHHQAICRLGNDLFTCSRSEDGIIEAIQGKGNKIIATQFHPERMNGYGDALFDYFLQKCV